MPQDKGLPSLRDYRPRGFAFSSAASFERVELERAVRYTGRRCLWRYPFVPFFSFVFHDRSPIPPLVVISPLLLFCLPVQAQHVGPNLGPYNNTANVSCSLSSLWISALNLYNKGWMILLKYGTVTVVCWLSV